MAKRKCVCCGEYIGTDEESVLYKGRYAHIKCFNVAVKALKKDKSEKLEEKEKSKKVQTKKPKVELKDAMSEEEYKEKQQYYQYLRELIDGDLSAKVYAMTENQISKYNFTFKEMYQTLVYLHEIIEKDLVNEVVGLIPYYYDEAKKYYESITEIENKNKDINTSKMYKEKTIYIKPFQRKNKQIDISSIGKEESKCMKD